MTETTYRPMDSDMVDQLLGQIGPRNLMGISGSRVVRLRDGGISLPIRYGYAVRVYLAANDTYVVQRTFTRMGVTRVKGEATDVYAERVGDLAWYASCYVSYDEKTWMHQA